MTQPVVEKASVGANTASEKLAQFSTMVTAAGWTLSRLSWRLRNTLRSVDWHNKDVLEIGCGRGDMSLYMALTGARRVEGIDPEGAGSTAGRQSIVQQRMAQLQLPNFRFQPIAFEPGQYEPESLDVIFGINVIEHIHETRQLLTTDPAAMADYQQFFADLYRVLRPGGALVFSNASRYSLWAIISQRTKYGIKTPIRSMQRIVWELHQPPEVWLQLFRQAGFQKAFTHWRVPYQLRSVPWLVDNRFVQFFSFADYTVTAIKAEK
jgi:SAM-dependent methyltransferase